MSSPVAAFAVFVGAAHILAWVCEEWQSRNLTDPPIGMPVREAWPDPIWKPVQEMMDRVYRTGVAEDIDMPGGFVRIVPYPESGPAEGVVSVHVRPRVIAPVDRTPPDPAMVRG